MKAQTSYLDLEERNGLVYEIGTANLFTGLVNVPLMHFFPDFYGLEEAPSKAKGKEFLSSFLFTYEEAPMVCGVDSILDLKPTRAIGKDLLEDFVCEFRYKSGLKHGISRELMLSGMGWGGDGGYWNKVKGLFIEDKFKQIALYGFDNKLEERGSCSENFLEGFDHYESGFPDEIKEGVWEYYDYPQKTKNYSTRPNRNYQILLNRAWED